MSIDSLPVIGKSCTIDIIGHAQDVPAKVDTGADSSAIWASDISIDKSGTLHFTLFDKESDFYSGEVISSKDFKVARVTSSSGHTQIRYRVKLLTRVNQKKINVYYNLSDRSNNQFPILIGRRTVAGKFLVDVTQGVKWKWKWKCNPTTSQLNDELEKDPYAFYQKYHSKTNQKGN